MDTIIEYISKGGILMIPLIFISFIMWILIIERLIFFRKLYSKDIERKQLLEIIKYRKEIPDKYGITYMLIFEILSKRNENFINPSIIDESVVRIVHRLDHHININSILASIAPLLGLLGTTTGMIKTFFAIAIFGTGNVKALAEGISEALITTQIGLFIAIPGIYMSNFLNQRSIRLKQKVSRIGMYLRRVVEGDLDIC